MKNGVRPEWRHSGRTPFCSNRTDLVRLGKGGFTLCPTLPPLPPALISNSFLTKNGYMYLFTQSAEHITIQTCFQ